MPITRLTPWIAFLAGLVYGIVLGGLSVAKGLGW
jgi:hypothetical protein